MQEKARMKKLALGLGGLGNVITTLIGVAVFLAGLIKWAEVFGLL